MRPKVLIICTNGTNRDAELAQAFELAGAQTECLHINVLRSQKTTWNEYQILAIPGGFSYGDVLGAGHLFAMDLQHYFYDKLHAFVESRKPVIGICNGFQALVKAGILPGAKTKTTLTFNERGRFECRWVHLATESQNCVWTQGISDLIYCPVAHGEGRLVFDDDIDETFIQQHVALRYAYPHGAHAHNEHPYNPNGSAYGIAGLCNEYGNVLGLMPHAENHIHAFQHPRFTRNEAGQLGLGLFNNGVRAIIK